MKRRRNKSTKTLLKELIALLLAFGIFQAYGYISGQYNSSNANEQANENKHAIATKTVSTETQSNYSAENILSFDLSSIPEYKDTPFVYINDNKPSFIEEDITTESFEKYSDLDSLGRCGVAYANICKEIMPKEGEERQPIGMIKPSGWKTVRYDDLIEDKYLYNRCHLIGYQLAGENANNKNLITGTRYFNVTGMLPFENQVRDYINKNKNNHVLYRVTPIYQENNLVANGVQMEAFSVEDNGEGVQFNVFVYNVQPGIQIDYATGESKRNAE
ncbi:MAG: DNA/RNA non-specific endonuclease [Clostridia bacterium]|nr:DNA/RNA non-specific endonuclease [Clostridia bacterium]